MLDWILKDGNQQGGIMTTIEKFKKAGICFAYSDHPTDYPQIPFSEDVLFVLRLVENSLWFSTCFLKHDEVYVDNVYLVAAAANYKIHHVVYYDEEKVRKIIARMIIDLCPEEARCLFNKSFVNAKKLLGENMVQPPFACTCPKHREGYQEGELENWLSRRAAGR